MEHPGFLRGTSHFCAFFAIALTALPGHALGAPDVPLRCREILQKGVDAIRWPKRKLQTAYARVLLEDGFDKFDWALYESSEKKFAKDSSLRPSLGRLEEDLAYLENLLQSRLNPVLNAALGTPLSVHSAISSGDWLARYQVMKLLEGSGVSPWKSALDTILFRFVPPRSFIRGLSSVQLDRLTEELLVLNHHRLPTGLAALIEPDQEEALRVAVKAWTLKKVTRYGIEHLLTQDGLVRENTLRESLLKVFQSKEMSWVISIITHFRIAQRHASLLPKIDFVHLPSALIEELYTSGFPEGADAFHARIQSRWPELATSLQEQMKRQFLYDSARETFSYIYGISTLALIYHELEKRLRDEKPDEAGKVEAVVGALEEHAQVLVKEFQERHSRAQAERIHLHWSQEQERLTGAPSDLRSEDSRRMMRLLGFASFEDPAAAPRTEK